MQFDNYGGGGGLVQSLNSCLTLVTPWTVVHQVPVSMGFLSQEYQSALPFPSPGDVTNSGTEQASLALAGEFFTSKPPGNPLKIILCMCMCMYVYVYELPFSSSRGSSRPRDLTCISCVSCRWIIYPWNESKGNG